MASWFVSRHPGALTWFIQKHIPIDHCVEHLDTSLISKNDTVYGVLPLHAIAEICEKGARYFALNFKLEFSNRGKELTAEVMDQLGCKLTQYTVTAIGKEK